VFSSFLNGHRDPASQEAAGLWLESHKPVWKASRNQDLRSKNSTEIQEKDDEDSQ